MQRAPAAAAAAGMSRRRQTPPPGSCSMLLSLVITAGAVLGVVESFLPPAALQCHPSVPFGTAAAARLGRNKGLPVLAASSRDGGSGGGVEDQGRRWGEMDRGGGGGDADDDLLSEVKGRDWRLFRKNLISRYGEDNGKDPWSDGCWAHDIGTVEAGCLLIATEEIDSGTFHQSVILVLSHARDQGTLGLILNRPGPQRLHSLPGLQPDLAEVFGDSQVFDGGPMGLGTMTVLHNANVEGSDPVLDGGVFAGGFDTLVDVTREQGRVSKDRVRFVHGHSAWSPGQLQGELDHNQWFVAAAAPELITEHCDKPFHPLWSKLLRLMGGRYQEVAKRNEPRL
ncbi:unnamed protein product [Ectocarpus sp. 12 AP-2014]